MNEFFPEQYEEPLLKALMSNIHLLFLTLFIFPAFFISAIYYINQDLYEYISHHSFSHILYNLCFLIVIIQLFSDSFSALYSDNKPFSLSTILKILSIVLGYQLVEWGWITLLTYLP